MPLKQAASLTGLSITFGVLSAIAPLMLAQDPQSHPSPVLPSNILGPQLIVWSQLQKPEPLRPAVRTFTGTIVNDRGKYVLKITSGSAYQLDDQQKARQYDGREVKLVGTQDENQRSVNVVSIELISVRTPT
jgi:Protein of unknown function (DUF5818)